MRIRFNIGGYNALIEEQVLMKKIEFAQVKKQVEVLGTFLPDELLKLTRDELQETQTFVGVLLFADVSGFTQLTEKYNKTGKGGIYRLTATLNAYIGAIVEVLYFYGGDVLKFSGDAFLALWKVMPEESLFEILHGVVACALVIQQMLGHFETEVNVELKVKLAISCGNMTFSVIGDNYTKHYVIAGEAINDVKAAEHGSVPGDVVISPGAWAHMLQERYETTPGEHDNIKVWSILYKPNEAAKKIFYHEKQLEATKLTEMHINHRTALHAKKRLDSNLSDSKMTERFIRTLPQRVQMKLAPKHWIVEDLRPFIIKPVQDLVDESQPVEYLTEMRDVTIQFINIVPLKCFDHNLIALVDRAYQIVCQIAGNALGVVNKVSLFDKDAMILVLFGLRAINHEMESQSALRSAYRIRAAIKELKDVQSASIGITNGYVYCGVVGHPMRREYTVIGGAVNKAARMMCAYLDKVTCDHKTFRRSKLSSYYFQLQSELKLKGIEDAGNIFEYNEDFDTPSFLHVTTLPTIGRSIEFDFIKTVVKNKSPDGYYGICFYGPSKIGKTRIIHMALKSLKESKKYTIASVALDGSNLIPYFCISSLYRQLYDQKTLIVNDEVEIINFPRNLWNVHESIQNRHDDIAWKKYRMLNYFRDLIRITYNKTTLLFIDNIEYIDQQSWEILDITLNDGCMRLIASATFDENNIEFQRNISQNNYIKQMEVVPIADKYVPIIACQLLAVCGIPKVLVSLLIRTCEGKPGYLQCCLLRLVNNGSVELELITKNENLRGYVFPPVELLGYTGSSILPIVRFSDKYRRNNDDLTLAAISLDLFDSFTPYQQLVIKTGACLGDFFTRTLLIIALKYPAEATLAKVIEQLFQEEILECGSRYIYASELDNAYQICCRCYFEEDFMNDKLLGLQKYAFCKILHFRNKSIRDVAYDILPNNQRTELHLICTDVLENINNKCPNCLRNPVNNYINFGKFKHLMNYCNNPKGVFVSTLKHDDGHDDLKECIRRCMRQNIYKVDCNESKSIINSVYDPNMCNCFDILARVYNDLIYHSESAAHIGKQIFFMMKYGLLLILMQDYTNAIMMLEKARELCLNDSKIQSTSLMGVFKKVVIGKIEIGLSKTFLELRRLGAAKNHLAIALRQYNIPSVSLAYKNFSILLTRSFLVNSKRIRRVLFKNTVIRNDMCICLNICTKLFVMEGNWTMAKLTSAYGLHLSRTVNTNVELLYESYCTAIDIARYTQDIHFCEKLQKYAVREIQQKYTNNLTFNLYNLNTLLINILELRYASGEICKAIRVGYRVLDICLKVSLMSDLSKCVYVLSLLLLYNFRISDCGDVCRILEKCSNEENRSLNLLIYHSLNLYIYRRGGFFVEPVENSVNFATTYFARKVRFSWPEHLFMSMLHVHFLLLGKYEKAEEWRHSCSFNRINIRRRVVFTTLIMILEAKILMYIRSRRVGSPNVKIEEKVILNLMELANSQAKHSPINGPVAATVSAWMYMIKNKKRKAYKLLNSAQKYAEKQDNYMEYAFITQLKNAWNGGFFYHYNNRPMLSYKEAMTFTPIAWAQYISPYPLE